MTDPQPFVDIRHAQKSYGSLEVLKDISLQVAKGEIVAIIGPSGSGKSTLLRAINDLDPLTGGEIWLEDTQVNKKLPHRQYEKHINHVRQNIGMGLTNGRISVRWVPTHKLALQVAYHRMEQAKGGGGYQEIWTEDLFIIGIHHAMGRTR